MPRDVYEAVKNDPKGKMVVIFKGISAISRELWDTGKTITQVNMTGDAPANFEKLGNAEMATALNGFSAALSAGRVDGGDTGTQ